MNPVKGYFYKRVTILLIALTIVVIIGILIYKGTK